MNALLLRIGPLVDAVLDSLEHLSGKLFVSHRGAYSVERLHALDSYCRRTSKRRALLVCSVLSMPPFMVSIGLEMIPLQNPADGWQANYGCWVRLYFVGFVVCLGALMQINALVPELEMSTFAMLRSCFATACGYDIMLISFAIAWVFPTPLAVVIGSIPFAAMLIGFFLLTVGIDRLIKQPSLRHQVVQQIYMVGVQAILVVVYSIFSVIYYLLPEQYKALYVLMLPVMKLAMQHIVAWATKELEEYQPGIIVFCVGVFNALYMSKCMQTSGSRVTYAVIVAMDALQGILSYRRLKKIIRNIHTLADACDSHDLLDRGFLQAIVHLSNEPGVFLDGATIRIRSPIKSRFLTMDDDRQASVQLQQSARPKKKTVVALLVRLKHGRAVKIWPGPKKPVTQTQAPSIPRANKSRPSSRVQPASTHTESFEQHKSAFIHMVNPGTLAPKNKIVQMSLKLLFECEYHVLVEYVESIVPLMYAMYVAIVCKMSAAEYYPETRGKNASQVDTMVANIVAYASVEVLSFIIMQLCVKWECGLSPVYLLAFVIENQTQELLGRLLVWYIFLLQFTLAHFGTFSLASHCSMELLQIRCSYPHVVHH